MHQQPPSYIGSLNDVNRVPVEGQNDNGSVSIEQRNTFVVPTHNVPAQSEAVTEITPKIRRNLILVGIGYIFGGVGAMALEMMTLVISYSSSLGGLWSGNLMLATGVVFIIIAGRKTQLFSPVVHLILFNFSATIAAVVFSLMELVATRPCTAAYDLENCDVETGKIIKLIMVGELNLSAFYSAMIVSYFWGIKHKSEPPSPPCDDYYIY